MKALTFFAHVCAFAPSSFATSMIRSNAPTVGTISRGLSSSGTSGTNGKWVNTSQTITSNRFGTTNPADLPETVLGCTAATQSGCDDPIVVEDLPKIVPATMSMRNNDSFLAELQSDCVLWDSSCPGNRTAAVERFFKDENGTSEYLHSHSNCFLQDQQASPGCGPVYARVRNWMRTPQCVSSMNEYSGIIHRTAGFSQTAQIGACCGAAQGDVYFSVGNVDVFYWPEPNANTSCLSIVGSSVLPLEYAATNTGIDAYWGCVTQQWGADAGDFGPLTYANGETYQGRKKAAHDFGPVIVTTATVASLASVTFKQYLVNPWDSQPCPTNSTTPAGSIKPTASNIPYQKREKFPAIVHSLGKRNGSRASTAVSGSFTFTSPSIYAYFSNLGASDECGGTTILSTMLTFAPGELSTIVGPVAQGSSRAFDFKDLPCPPQSIMEENWWKPKFGEPYRPFIAIPSQIKNMNSLFRVADMRFISGYDPPRTLVPASAMATPLTSIDPASTLVPSLPDQVQEPPANVHDSSQSAAAPANTPISPSPKETAKPSSQDLPVPVPNGNDPDKSVASSSQTAQSPSSGPNVAKPNSDPEAADQVADPKNPANPESPSNGGPGSANNQQSSNVGSVNGSPGQDTNQQGSTATGKTNNGEPNAGLAGASSGTSSETDGAAPVANNSPLQQSQPGSGPVNNANSGPSEAAAQDTSGQSSSQSTPSGNGQTAGNGNLEEPSQDSSGGNDALGSSASQDPGMNNADQANGERPATSDQQNAALGNTPSPAAGESTNPNLSASESSEPNQQNSSANDQSPDGPKVADYQSPSTPASTLAVANHAIVIGPSAVHVDGSAVQTQAQPVSLSGAAAVNHGSSLVLGNQIYQLSSPTPAPPTTIAGHAITPVTNGAIVNGNTITAGANAATISNTPVSVDSSSQVHIGDSIHQLPAVNAAPTTTTLPNGISAVVLSNAVSVHGTTLTAGAPAATVSGTPISLDSSNNLIYGPTAVALPSVPAGMPASGPIVGLVTTINNHPVVPLTQGISIAGTTLTPGGSPIVVSNTPISFGSSALIIGSSSIPILPPVATNPSNFEETTIGDHPVVPLTSGISIAGTTLTPGAPPITVSNTPISLGPSAIMIGASSIAFTPPSPSPLVASVGGQALTADASAAILGGTMLSQGAPALTISGTAVSLDTAGQLMLGSSTVALAQPAANSLIMTVGGQALTANPSGVAVGTNTLTPGAPAITISGESISSGTSGGLVIGSSTIPLIPSSGSGLLTTIAGQALTANPSEIILPSQTLSPGAPGVTINGTPISLGSSGQLVVGSSTISLGNSNATFSTSTASGAGTGGISTAASNLGSSARNSASGPGSKTSGSVHTGDAGRKQHGLELWWKMIIMMIAAYGLI